MLRTLLLSTVVTAALLLPIAQAQTRPANGATPPARVLPVDAAFQAWDADHNGMLSQPEFRTGWIRMQRMREEAMRVRGQFNAVDSNHNQAIDASEYANLMLVKRAGTKAPALATFDGNRDGRLQFPEYVQFLQRMLARAAQPGSR